MIKIVYERSRHRLTCEGHAGSAEPGRDIVCAACSMLIYGLAQSIINFRHGLTKNPVAKLGSGDAVISCKPTKKMRANIEMIYWSYINGFMMLAHNYPDYVTYEEKP